ncbi:MAG: amino acid adenylation domain-containing protein, partial [Acidobacteria bacterium]|nr:amino acid adenylation domain-containing protein [Acidobacteriota bacterium]
IEAFLLKLVAVDTGCGLSLEFHYDSSRLSAASVAQIASYFETLLQAAVAASSTPVSRLPLLNANEHTRLLTGWNQTAVDYPRRCLQEWFEAQAARTPHRPAVRFGERVLSYRELNQAANQLAHHLRRLGVGPDSRVGLCVERSAEMIVALMAILKAGGAYVPVNADNPKPRLGQQLAGVVALITEHKLEARLPALAAPILYLDSPQPPWAKEPGSNPPLTTTVENLVYVIYTSGSSGVPKGVAVRHRNLVNYTYFITQLLAVEAPVEGLQFATVSTLAADLGNTCIYPALVSGGCLHVIAYEIATDAHRLARYTAQYPIDVLKIVPSHLAALLDSPEGPQVLPRRYLFTGGETLTRTLVNKVAAAGASCQLINHYGPTETTVGSLILPLRDYQDEEPESEAIPLGRPIANTQVYILDAQQQPVPVGVVGELYIGGEGVAAGYLGQPELSGQKFLSNPFRHTGVAPMYRSGDLARYRANGLVEFLGRSDDQVKVRGYRIELGEIEYILGQHPAIKQAVVLARADAGGGKQLVAYVVARDPQSAVGNELKAYVGEHLPDYMVPSVIVPLEKLPLTPNGKIDRQALPAPEQLAAKTYIPPRTPTEQQVAAIWREVLKRDQISVQDNFFELGGHSLAATQVISRVRELFQVELAIRVLFETPTVSALVEAIQAAGQAGPSDSAAIRPVVREAYRAKSS